VLQSPENNTQPSPSTCSFNYSKKRDTNDR
jgi:hypothetical protein